MTDSTPAPTPQPAGAPAPAPAGADFPGKTLGIVGLVLAILVPLVGLIISIVANNQSKAAGYTNQLAKIGIIVGIILTVLYLIFAIVLPIILSAAALSSIPNY
jgi:hypothetical protein